MLDKIKGEIIVSCQALEEEPLHGSEVMAKMAIAAEAGGAQGIRANGVSDIEAIKKVTSLPIIGIIKKEYPNSDVYITPTSQEVMELIEVGVDMIAIDATSRQRPNNEQLSYLLHLIKASGVKAMADISTFDEAVEAERLGFDCVSTTLSGYTSYSEILEGPNVTLIRKLHNHLEIPVIAEGKINNPNDLLKVFDVGAFSAVIGSAITRPQEITKKFVEVISK